MNASDVCQRSRFTFNAILARQQAQGIEWHHIAPGRPVTGGAFLFRELSSYGNANWMMTTGERFAERVR
jgi:hypothetical protein